MKKLAILLFSLASMFALPAGAQQLAPSVAGCWELTYTTAPGQKSNQTICLQLGMTSGLTEKLDWTEVYGGTVTGIFRSSVTAVYLPGERDLVITSKIPDWTGGGYTMVTTRLTVSPKGTTAAGSAGAYHVSGNGNEPDWSSLASVEAKMVGIQPIR